tara:strand:- start:1160 stop:1762 length:603 start_codon:yes stop_codon:yes gene_type:complete
MTTSTKPAKPEAITTQLPDYGIFVECVATRNKQQTHGFWIDLEKLTRPMDICFSIQWILQTGPNPEGEEWEITDHTCPGFLIEKSFPEIFLWINDRTSLPDDEGEAFEAFTQELGQVVGKEYFKDAFAGLFQSEADFVWRRYEKQQGVNLDPISQYVDWEKLWANEYETDGWKSCRVYIRGTNSKIQGRSAIFKPARSTF